MAFDFQVAIDCSSPHELADWWAEALGWEVRVLEGLDHMQAMQAAQVLPILRPWLTSALGGS